MRTLQLKIGKLITDPSTAVSFIFTFYVWCIKIFVILTIECIKFNIMLLNLALYYMPFPFCCIVSVFCLMPIKYSIEQLYPDLFSKSPVLAIWSF